MGVQASSGTAWSVCWRIVKVQRTWPTTSRRDPEDRPTVSRRKWAAGVILRRDPVLSPGPAPEYTQSWLDSLRARVSSIVGGFFRQDRRLGGLALRGSGSGRSAPGAPKVKDLAYYYDATQRTRSRTEAARRSRHERSSPTTCCEIWASGIESSPSITT